MNGGEVKAATEGPASGGGVHFTSSQFNLTLLGRIPVLDVSFL